MEIPQVVVERLPVYARALAQLEDEKRELVSSQELGARLGITPAQIRKDLSYFGHFGKQGRGYNVVKLSAELRSILGLDRQWRIVLVGVGRLGRAIVGYSGFAPQGFRISSIFDTDMELVGKQLGKLEVKDISELEDILADNPVDIGIVAVPAAEAQSVIDRLIACGVRAILNYAPVAPHVPRGVYIRHIDPVLVMQSMTFYLKAQEE